jgi:hypothetical protein
LPPAPLLEKIFLNKPGIPAQRRKMAQYAANFWCHRRAWIPQPAKKAQFSGRSPARNMTAQQTRFFFYSMFQNKKIFS